MLGTGAGLCALNVGMARSLEEFFVMCLFVGPALTLLGLWRAAFGNPIDPHTGRKARWFWVGIGVCVAVGVVVSIVTFLMWVDAGYDPQLEL
jgi:hypothetical protein